VFACFISDPRAHVLEAILTEGFRGQVFADMDAVVMAAMRHRSLLAAYCSWALLNRIGD